VEEIMEMERKHRRTAGGAGGTGAAAAGTGAAGAAAAASLDPPGYPWKSHLYTQQHHHQQHHHQQQQHGPPNSSGIMPSRAAASSSSSISPPQSLHPSCYGSWPVPWDCPFKFRRLVWRLLGRLKPSSLRFWAEREHMCAHAPHSKKWKHMVSHMFRRATVGTQHDGVNWCLLHMVHVYC
jgi:hypothetical protein